MDLKEKALLAVDALEKEYPEAQCSLEYDPDKAYELLISPPGFPPSAPTRGSTSSPRTCLQNIPALRTSPTPRRRRWNR